MNITSFAQRVFLSLFLLSAPTVWANQQVIPSAPQLAAKSYVLLDAASGKVLVENNGDQRLPPASLTKLMTAYIATAGNSQRQDRRAGPGAHQRARLAYRRCRIRWFDHVPAAEQPGDRG